MAIKSSKIATPAELNSVAKKFKTQGDGFIGKVKGGTKNRFADNIKRIEQFKKGIK